MPLCQLTNRALLRLSGPDTRAFLQALVTQDMQALAADRPLYAGLLSPQGKALFQLFLFAASKAADSDVLIDVAAADRPALMQLLLRYRLRKRLEIVAEDTLVPFQQWDMPAGHAPDPRTPLAGQRFPAPAAAGAAPVALWHQKRLSLGLPDADEVGHDELLWLETNGHELHGVSFDKGCYVGQENTARMHHRKRLRKRLLPLRLSGPPVAADDAVMAGEVAAGRLRGARHGDLQMALLRLEQLDRPLSVGGQPATLVRPPWFTAGPA